MITIKYKTFTKHIQWNDFLPFSSNIILFIGKKLHIRLLHIFSIALQWVEGKKLHRNYHINLQQFASIRKRASCTRKDGTALFPPFRECGKDTNLPKKKPTRGWRFKSVEMEPFSPCFDPKMPEWKGFLTSCFDMSIIMHVIAGWSHVRLVGNERILPQISALKWEQIGHLHLSWLGNLSTNCRQWEATNFVDFLCDNLEQIINYAEKCWILLNLGVTEKVVPIFNIIFG